MNEADEWEKARQFARASLGQAVITDQQLSLFANSCPDPQSFNTLIKYIYQSSKSRPNPAHAVTFFLDQVDDSDYALAQWIKAFLYFDQWLQKNNLSSEIVTMLGYIGCCSLAPENKTHKRDLCGLLEQMLLDHGFQAAIKRP